MHIGQVFRLEYHFNPLDESPKLSGWRFDKQDA